MGAVALSCVFPKGTGPEKGVPIGDPTCGLLGVSVTALARSGEEAGPGG